MACPKRNEDYADKRADDLQFDEVIGEYIHHPGEKQWGIDILDDWDDYL